MDSVRHYCLVLSHEDQVRISQAQDKLQFSSRSGQSWELSYTEYRLQIQQFPRLSHKSKYVRLRLGVAKYRRVSVVSPSPKFPNGITEQRARIYCSRNWKLVPTHCTVSLSSCFLWCKLKVNLIFIFQPKYEACRMQRIAHYIYTLHFCLFTPQSKFGKWLGDSMCIPLDILKYHFQTHIDAVIHW